MAELDLDHDTLIALRAQAHRLDPVVLMGAGGLSAAVVREIDRALAAHGLVKVRAGRMEREEKEAMFVRIAEQLGAARVKAIGHTFVLYRPVPEPRVDPLPPLSRKRERGGTARARGIPARARVKKR
jgi:RNA-binding protein